jgi:hypothetical protein
MRIRRMSATFMATLLLTLPITATAQSMGQWAGTWTINLDKSTYEAGPRPDAATVNTVVLGVIDGQLRITSGPVNARWINVVRFDGVYRWIDDRTDEWVQKVNGQVTTTRVTVYERQPGR